MSILVNENLEKEFYSSHIKNITISSTFFLGNPLQPQISAINFYSSNILPNIKNLQTKLINVVGLSSDGRSFGNQLSYTYPLNFKKYSPINFNGNISLMNTMKSFDINANKALYEDL